MLLIDSTHAFEMNGIYFHVYLKGSCYLIPSLNHYWPNVHFTGTWLCRNDIMCLDFYTSSLRGWWQHGVGKELFLLHLHLMSITSHLPTGEVVNAFVTSSSHADC